MPSDAAPEDTAREQGLFIATASESQARARRVLPTEGSEDMSHLLVAPAVGEATQKLDDADRDYLPNPQIDWIVRVDLEGDPVLARADLLKVLSAEWAEASGGPELFGYSPEDKHWTYLRVGDGPDTFAGLRFSWRLFDIWGEPPTAMTAFDLRKFAECVRHACQGFGNASVEPETAPEDGEKQAANLSKLADTCDREITVVLQAPSGMTFEGRDIWDAMLCLGLPWGDMDIFHWPNKGESGDDAYLSVWTSTPPGYFFPELIAAGQVQTEDLVFGYSLPRSADPAAVLGAMVKAARYAQKRLGGDLLGASGEAFNEADILDEIETVSERLRNAGFAPGSDAALRQF